MGFRTLELNMPTDFQPGDLQSKISKKLRIKSFTYTIEKQSLDARNKRSIHWKVRVGVSSAALKGPESKTMELYTLPYKKQDKQVVVAGSGPAGFFAAYTLQSAGFDVVLLEQGPEVNRRFKDIVSFERTGELNPHSNYAFGEGGAGTFSDGKLTSRTKTISRERSFIFDTYIGAGAPPEIAYMAHPHLGSDILRKIVKNLRRSFLDLGGVIHFDTRVIGVNIEKGQIRHLEINQTGNSAAAEGDYFIFATGHSSYDTYRMLIGNGIPFRVKRFALGCRVEHPQELINHAQWGRSHLPGIKAAEYRLAYKENGQAPVYSFCMCPGGKVVPATAGKKANVVNGMSNYSRSAPFANAAVVAGTDIQELLERDVSPLEALDWLEKLEKTFYDYSGSYAAPACKISDFLQNNSTAFSGPVHTSYPFGLAAADFTDLLPKTIVDPIKSGMFQFNRKLKGFDQGIMLGLESKTSAILRAVRNDSGKVEGFENLYISGEGSGLAGGIISSAADGMKAALNIISREK